VEAHVSGDLVGRIFTEGGHRRTHDRLGDLDLTEFRASSYLLQGMPLPVPTLEIHPGVDTYRVLAQDLFDDIDRLEEASPFVGVQEPYRRDGIGDGDLIGGLLLL
jgi:hypothetical protein